MSSERWCTCNFWSFKNFCFSILSLSVPWIFSPTDRQVSNVDIKISMQAVRWYQYLLWQVCFVDRNKGSHWNTAAILRIAVFVALSLLISWTSQIHSGQTHSILAPLHTYKVSNTHTYYWFAKLKMLNGTCLHNYSHNYRQVCMVHSSTLLPKTAVRPWGWD